MIVDMKRVCEKVSKQKNVILDIEPFFKPDVTRIHLVKDLDGDEMERIAGFDFQADLLAYISENDLYQYLSIQIDRVLAGKPAQSIRLS
jgi:hypothetical protein